MKHTLLSITFLLVGAFSLLQAQITLDATYFPAAGDTLFTTVADNTTGVSITTPGGDQTWDFTGMSAGTARERVAVAAADGEGSADFPEAQMLVYQATGAEGYYTATEEAFSIVGYYGADPLGQGLNVSTPFSPAYVERWAPLNFFDLNENNSALLFGFAADDIPGNIFDDLPISPDSIQVKINTDRTDLVDAWGTVMIPGGEYEVLREKRTEYRDIRLEAKIGILPWFDITDIALDFLPIDQLGGDTLVTYSFWSDEAKEPIVVISADAEENITEVEYKTLDIVNDVVNVNLTKPKFNVYPNPSLGNVRFDFSGYEPGTYDLTLFNLTGKAVWSKSYQINGSQKIDAFFGHLPKGYYLYALSDNKGNRLHVSRLVLMNP